ncbi:MAG: DUF3253 domain-containing protein [Roseovarius sp.]|uniref:DUF3253 domain-containing protein n=1 Tax=Roseovarius sp. TaxID=1486281 RepID=UPI0032EF4730
MGRYLWAMGVTRERIAGEVVRLCEARGPGKTVCPSEVARALEAEEAAWRALMPEVREVAAGLARKGRIAVYRKGRVVDDPVEDGPIRLGLPPE